MNPIAMYGAGGLLAVALLFSGMYGASSVFGKVSYEKPTTQTASVVESLPEPEPVVVEEEPEETEEVVEEEPVQEPEEELIPAIEEAPAPPAPEPEPVTEETSSDHAAVAALQEQVNSLLEQVADATAAQVQASEETNDDPGYFVTPGGVKIDANGNVVNDDGTVEESEPEETTQQQQTQTEQVTLPSGYYRLPNGTIIGPGGEVVDEDDLREAERQEEQAFEVRGTSCFELPNGNKIDAYGQPCDE